MTHYVESVKRGWPISLPLEGRPVRDILHVDDFSRACKAFIDSSGSYGLYNLGGGKNNSCSILEAFKLAEKFSGRAMKYSYVDQNRIGDHRWWISDLEEFKRDYPDWSLRYDVQAILHEIHEANAERRPVALR